MSRNYFLLKTESDEYGWSDLLREKIGKWDGVRNYQARNNLRAMKVGDYALIYHTGKERQIVGFAEVVREAYPDASAEGRDFSCVDVAPVCPLLRPVSLAQIKADSSLAEMVLVKNSRLSVQPVTAKEFRRIAQLAETPLP